MNTLGYFLGTHKKDIDHFLFYSKLENTLKSKFR